MDADGSNPIRLTNDAGTDMLPSWWQDPNTLATDSAPPVLLSAPSPNANGTMVFMVGGHLVDFVFSEVLSGVATEAELESALTFAAGATDGDNLPSTGGGVNPFTLATNATLNNTIRVAFSTGNTANTDLLLVGTHTARVTVGTNITDLAGNPAATAPAAVVITGTGGPTAPVIAVRETIDNDADGQIDHIKITTDQALNDNFGDLTITVSGYTVTGYVTEIGAGGVNDHVFYVQLTESGSPDTGVLPTVLVTTNTLLADVSGTNTLVLDPTPDSKIAFRSDRDGNAEIYVMDADGSNQINLTNNAAGDEWPSWSPDGSQIAFDSIRDGNFEIYVMDADGSNQTRLTNNGAADSATSVVPRWHQDRLYVGPGWQRRDLRHGRRREQPDQPHEQRSAGPRPSWSPDGTQIAFYTDRDGNNEIYVMDADGSNPINLTNNAASDLAPVWSPDGSRIAFQSGRDGNAEIFVMDADGSNPINLTNNTAVEQRAGVVRRWQQDSVPLRPGRQRRDLRHGRRRDQPGEPHERRRARLGAGMVAGPGHAVHRLGPAGASVGPLAKCQWDLGVFGRGTPGGLCFQRGSERGGLRSRARIGPHLCIRRNRRRQSAVHQRRRESVYARNHHDVERHDSGDVQRRQHGQ